MVPDELYKHLAANGHTESRGVVMFSHVVILATPITKESICEEISRAFCRYFTSYIDYFTLLVSYICTTISSNYIYQF